MTDLLPPPRAGVARLFPDQQVCVCAICYDLYMIHKLIVFVRSRTFKTKLRSTQITGLFAKTFLSLKLFTFQREKFFCFQIALTIFLFLYRVQLEGLF